MMNSQRPATPPRSVFALPVIDETSGTSTNPQSKAGGTHKTYDAHVFDLLYPIRDAVPNLGQSYIPAAFLQVEAVDSSVRLGEGASFVASLQRIPKGPAKIVVESREGQSSHRKTYNAPEHPSHVVYKVASVKVDDQGRAAPEDRVKLQNVLTELHALVFPPLKAHENIIQFLGMAFGSNPFSPTHRLPVIVQEYVQHGTLTDLLHKHSPLKPNVKHSLCLDSARGLHALHEAGLVHGDVKADNILICSHPTRTYIAKVADFGFSIIQAEGSPQVSIGGTAPWKAPEASGTLSQDRLPYTDIFSLGLLVWSVALDIANPFFAVLGPSILPDDIEQSKRDGSLLRLGSSMERMQGSRESLSANAVPHNPMAEVHDPEEKLLESLGVILEHSISPVPLERDIEMVLAILESIAASSEEKDSGTTLKDNSWTDTITNHSTTETQHFRLPAGAMVDRAAVLLP